MDTLFMTARNIRHSIHEGKVEPEIEAVLTSYRRDMKFVGGGGVASTERTVTTRLRLSPDAARKFAESLIAWADEAEKEAAMLTLKQ